MALGKVANSYSRSRDGERFPVNPKKVTSHLPPMNLIFKNKVWGSIQATNLYRDLGGEGDCPAYFIYSLELQDSGFLRDY